MHGDIVLLEDHLEDYYRLTEKSLASFRWADEHLLSSDVQYVAKVDDDMFVDPFRLLDVLRLGARRENNGENNGEGGRGGGWVTYPKRGLYMGHSNGPFVPYRANDPDLSDVERKWVIGIDEYDARNFPFGAGQDDPNHPGPEYASGGLYVLSRDVVSILSKAARQRKDGGSLIKFEDVNVGLLLHGAGVGLSRFQECWRYPYQCTEDTTVALHFGFSSRGLVGMDEMCVLLLSFLLLLWSFCFALLPSLSSLLHRGLTKVLDDFVPFSSFFPFSSFPSPWQVRTRRRSPRPFVLTRTFQAVPQSSRFARRNPNRRHRAANQRSHVVQH